MGEVVEGEMEGMVVMINNTESEVKRKYFDVVQIAVATKSSNRNR